jgi:hypothetical protein
LSRARLVAVILFLFMFARMAHAATVLSPVVDEQSHLSRGLSVWRTGDLRLKIAHPIALNLWEALPLAPDPAVQLPLDDESWINAAWDRFGERFLWRVNDNPDGIVFRARVMVMLLTLALGALVYRWAGELYGAHAALFALALYTFDPNILAHGMLVTTDLGVTLFIFAATYALWKATRLGERKQFVVAGILTGFAFVSKYSGLFLAPIFVVMFLISPRGEGQSRVSNLLPLFTRYLLLGVSGVVVVLIVYAFRIDLYVGELNYLLSETQTHPSFFLGQTSFEGWGYYFPIVFLLKTPLPLLLLIGAAIAQSFRRRAWRTESFMLLPALLYFALIILAGFNVGYRHILPALPFLMVYVSRAMYQVSRATCQAPSLRFAFYSLLFLWLVLSSSFIHPDYIAYFNEAAPYPRYELSVDSNLDWGQGLKALRAYMDAHSIERIRLSYFGASDPAAYGIAYDVLPRWPPPQQVDFNPINPAPGMYAISASNLQGVLLAEPTTFDWFRRRTPDAIVGQSILVYDVQADPNPPSVVGLCREPWTPIEDEQVEPLFDRDGLRVVRFDCADVWWSPPDAAWYVAPPGVDAPGVIEYERRRGNGSLVYRVVRSDPPQQPPGAIASFEGGLALIAFDQPREARVGQALRVASRWRVDAPPDAPVSFFAHLLDARGAFIAGSDGFGAPVELLQAGDVLTRTHRFELPPDLPTDQYRIAFGFYRLDTLERYRVIDSGRDSVVTDSFVITK